MTDDRIPDGTRAWVSTIGPVSAHEIDALATLMREIIEPLSYYNEPARRSEIAKYQPAALHSMFAEDSQSILVARDADGLTGFCISAYDDATIWLYWFGVAPRARGRGLGSALITALSATLTSRGAHKVWCDSRTDNKESIAVLERAGFQRVATLENHWFNQDYYLWECYPTG